MIKNYQWRSVDTRGTKQPIIDKKMLRTALGLEILLSASHVRSTAVQTRTWVWPARAGSLLGMLKECFAVRKELSEQVNAQLYHVSSGPCGSQLCGSISQLCRSIAPAFHTSTKWRTKFVGGIANPRPARTNKRTLSALGGKSSGKLQSPATIVDIHPLVISPCLFRQGLGHGQTKD